MNKNNVRKFCSEYFTNHNVNPNDIFHYYEYNGEYKIKRSFLEEMVTMIDETNFYEYCLQDSNFDKVNQADREKFIIKEIRKCVDTVYDENDLEDCDFIYNWYFKRRIQYSILHDVEFFIDIFS